MPCRCQQSDPNSPLPPGADGCVVRRHSNDSQQINELVDQLVSSGTATPLEQLLAPKAGKETQEDEVLPPTVDETIRRTSEATDQSNSHYYKEETGGYL